MKSFAIAFVAFLISATMAQAQLAPADAKRGARIRALIEWTIKEGRDNSLQEAAARDLGLSNSAIPGKRKAYEDLDTKELYFFFVLPVNGVDQYVLAYIYPHHESELWTLEPSGVILKRWVYAPNNSGFRKEPNLDLFDKIVSHLENEMSKAGH